MRDSARTSPDEDETKQCCRILEFDTIRSGLPDFHIRQTALKHPLEFYIWVFVPPAVNRSRFRADRPNCTNLEYKVR